MTGQEASAIIEEALNRVLTSNEDHDENDLLIDWVVIGFCDNSDPDKGYSYPMFFSNGEIPKYRSRGLLNTALLELED
jgi:hypothetical protein